MATNLSDCQLQVWRPDSSRRSLALSDLELTISAEGGTVTAKQFSELSPTSFFVAYKLQTSNCTYISSENLSADVRIIYLRLEEPVSATICIDESTNPEAIADEMATLQLCPMTGTRLPTGCKIGLIVPQHSRHTIPISRLLEVFGDGSKEEKRPSGQLQFPTVVQKDKSQSASITLSNGDLDYLEKFTKPKPNCGLSGQNRGQQRNQEPRQRKNPPLPSVSTEPIDLARSLRGEKALVDNWAKQKEMWDQLSKPKNKQNKLNAQATVLESTTDASGDPRNQWNSFAASHASPGDTRGITAQAGRTFMDPVSTPDETRGYLRHSDRDYDQSNSQQFSPRKASTYRGYRGRGRGRGRFRAASFIPPTNAAWTTRPEPNW